MSTGNSASDWFAGAAGLVDSIAAGWGRSSSSSSSSGVTIPPPIVPPSPPLLATVSPPAPTFGDQVIAAAPYVLAIGGAWYVLGSGGRK